MKSLIFVILFTASTLSFADMDWDEKPVSLQDLRSQAVSEINQNISKAGGIDRLFEDAIKGNADAHYALGLMHLYGVVKDKDIKQSLKHLREASSDNHIRAVYRLGVIYMGKDDVVGRTGRYIDRSTGIQLVSQAAESGIAEAQYLLGMNYIEGDILPEDRDLGLFWLTRAKDQGHGQAIKDRQALLESAPTLNMSFDYVQKRAIEGNPAFLVQLAEFYDTGWKVERNKRKAERLLMTAAEMGHKKAVEKLQERGIRHDAR